MAETTVPMRIEEKALARVEELGMRREFEQMLAHVQQTARGLLAIEVTREDFPEQEGCGLDVIINAYRDEPPEGAIADRTDLEWGIWSFDTFGPTVKFHIGMLTWYGGPDGW